MLGKSLTILQKSKNIMEKLRLTFMGQVMLHEENHMPGQIISAWIQITQAKVQQKFTTRNSIQYALDKLITYLP